MTTLVLFCVTLFDSPIMFPCGPKHVGMLRVILKYEYLRSKFVHFLVWCREYVIDIAREEQYKYLNTRLRDVDRTFTFTFTFTCYTLRAVTVFIEQISAYYYYHYHHHHHLYAGY